MTIFFREIRKSKLLFFFNIIKVRELINAFKWKKKLKKFLKQFPKVKMYL